MKQTAVEWLLNAIETKNGDEFSSYYSEFIEQAKEIEKEQIKKAYNDGEEERHNKSVNNTKWQAKRMYSEEEVLKLILDSEEYTSRFNGRTDLRSWFEQFKHK
jgi:hypothetical protein